MNVSQQMLKAAAMQVVGHFACSDHCTAGGVAAALMTVSGEIFTGICIDTHSSLGFCAEHAAIAEMLKHRQTRIAAIVAVDASGRIMPPCGRCRELIRQVDAENWNTEVLISDSNAVALGSLLPFSAPAIPPAGVEVS
jgi:cytidine deaminase